ncbi:hypothetical protein GLA29479_2597 [Lysobacter antibioticus]|nr:hypothetical protein GLA29479_2597 [Lysobacter antibioticus]
MVLEHGRHVLIVNDYLFYAASEEQEAAPRRRVGMASPVVPGTTWTPSSRRSHGAPSNNGAGLLEWSL